MTREEVVEKINRVLREEFEIDESLLKPESHFVDDLKLDSLDAVDMIVCFEEELKIKVSGERFLSVRTLGDIYALVYEIIQESQA